jgi:hypothetical protein
MLDILIAGLTLSRLAPQMLAQTPTSPCPDSAAAYQAQFKETKRAIAMVCYQYVVQQNSDTAVEMPTTPAPPNRQKITDIFGRRVKDNKLITEEAWKPLPGFDKLFYDTKTLSRFYNNARTNLQIMGTSTLGDNPFKIAMTIDCSDLKLQYNGVAKRLTRVYDYDSQYQLVGDFPKASIQEACDALDERPILISPSP